MADRPHDETDPNWLVPKPGIDYAEPDPDSLWAYRHVNGFIPVQKSMAPIRRLSDLVRAQKPVPPTSATD